MKCKLETLRLQIETGDFEDTTFSAEATKVAWGKFEKFHKTVFPDFKKEIREKQTKIDSLPDGFDSDEEKKGSGVKKKQAGDSEFDIPEPLKRPSAAVRNEAAELIHQAQRMKLSSEEGWDESDTFVTLHWES